MTRFVDVPTMVDLIAVIGVETFIGELSQRIESDFKRWSQFDKTARVASHSKTGVIELMPVADGERYALKYVNGHPSNTQAGLSTVMAFGVLSQVETGYPIVLSELTITSALRTAVTSLMAARWLARPGATTMAIIGNGAQSEFQALAFYAHLGIRRLNLYDVDGQATAKLRQNLSHLKDLELRHAASIAQAVQGADIVTTITADKSLATIITLDMLAPGMHLNAVGGDCPGKTELHAEVLRRASVFVEYEPQSRLEGDIQQMPLDFPVQELWRVLCAQAPGRQNPDEITVFNSVGFALEDYSTLRYIHEQVMLRNKGYDIELVPDLGDSDDPKDLFGLAMGKSAKARPKLRLIA